MNWAQGDQIKHPVLGKFTFTGQRCGLLWFDSSTGISTLGLEAASIEKKLKDPESKWTRVDAFPVCSLCGKDWGLHKFEGIKPICP